MYALLYILHLNIRVMGHAEHNETALSIVSSFHTNSPPPRGPPAELPWAGEDSPCAGCGQDMDEVVCCDACERGFHVSCAGAVGPDEEWVCEACESGGFESKRWPLGFVSRSRKKRRLLEVDDDGDGGSRDIFEVVDHCKQGFGLQKAAAHPAKAVELSFEDILCDKELADMYLERLKEFIFKRHGVLEEGWWVKIISSSTGAESEVVYYSPNGKPFRSMPEVAIHLGLISNNVVDPEEDTASFSLQLIDVLPIQYEDFFVLSLGQVDARPSYHKTDQIWPVGYKSYWHDKITGSNFVCEVLNGGDNGPVFRVCRFSCSTIPVPGECTHLFALNHGWNKEKQDIEADLNCDEEEDSNLQMLLADPLTENDSRCSLGNSPDISANDPSIFKDEVGEFYVEDSSPSAVWRMVAVKLVDICREMYMRGSTLNFCCEHVGDGKDEENCTYLAKLSSSLGSFKVQSVNEDGVEIETVFEGLRKWLDQDRFGLEVEFVQEIIELLPGVHTCSQYKSLKSRNYFSPIGNNLLKVKTKDGKHMEGEGALRRLVESCKRVKGEQDSVMKCHNLPMGRPVCTKLPSEIVGDAIQVLEFFRRFSEVLAVEDFFSVDQLEMEFSFPYFDDLNIQQGKFGLNILENSHITTSSQSALSIAHMSLLKVLYCELLSKVSAVMDPSSDIRDSKPKRGRKKSMDLSVLFSGKTPNMLPFNEFTWPELTRRYLLAVLSMDGDAGSLESGNAYRCLVGDGGQLCGSLTGVLGMEADALLLAQAMKKIFGSLGGGDVMLTVDDGGADQPSGCGSRSPSEGNIPEWAQLLEPVRKLPTNVGARIRKCVNAALEKGPPDWAKKILENSISKEIYKANASGPTKKAVLSVLEIVCCEGDGQKPVKERKKPNEERKIRNYFSICDIIMRQCHFIWRQVANADGEKVFCNLPGRRLTNFYNTEDEGILGSPANGSRPLDCRTIDLRLAVGAYNGSHETFLEDVQEFWNHVRISYGEKPDLLQQVDKLSSKFDELYEKEVLGPYQKLLGYARSGCLSADSKNEVDGLIASSGVLPKAPWEAGICKICGIDKDDKLVLLCDYCDAEYHTYCLNPPLARVPPGNWHCPSCVSKQGDGKETSACDSANDGSRRQNHGEFTGLRFNALIRLASLLEDKNYWEYSVNERTTLLKFLTDELLNSALLHQHLEHCWEPSAKLQQKLRAAYIDLRNVKQREKTLAENFAKTGKGSPLEVNEQYGDPSSVSPALAENSLTDSTDYGIELNLVRNEITYLQHSIGNMEMQLMKLSGRREFLGADSVGRLYWVWANLGRQLCVIVSDVDRSLPHGLEMDSCGLKNVVTLNSPWVLYQSPSELKELMDFLRDDDPKERELKWSILLRLKLRFQDPENEAPDETQVALSEKCSPYSESLATKAADFLESAYGPLFVVETNLLNKQEKKAKIVSRDKLFRCSCLEPVLPSCYHCLSCHKTFLTKRESDGHNDNQCKPGLAALSESKCDGSSNSDSFALFAKLKQYENNDLLCPYNFEDICSKFVTMDSLKDLVREIGFLGSNGVPLFIPSISPNLDDPTLKLNGPAKDTTIENKIDNLAGSSNGPLGRSSGGEPAETHGSDKPENISSGASCCHIPKSALKPLVGKAYHVLIQLKMNLLDMEAALPKAALRLSRACIERRWAWRSFVKSARTIDEMVQAVIVFEDMIKSEYLKKSWWYWSSLSAAARISTLSALALRIYSLDAAIIFDKSSSGFVVDKSDEAENDVLARKAKKKRSE